MQRKLVLLVATVLTIAWSQVRAGDPVQDDLGKLKGTWVAIKAIYDGEEIDPKKIEGKITLVFNVQKVTFYAGKVARESTFKIDPTKKPKSIDLTTAKLDPEGNKLTLPGIYQIDGDTLKFAQSSQAFTKGVVLKRPTDFDSKTGVSVLILRREKEKAK